MALQGIRCGEQRSRVKEARMNEGVKSCPSCGQEIEASVEVCTHCGKIVEGVGKQPELVHPPSESESSNPISGGGDGTRKRSRKIVRRLLAVLAILVLLVLGCAVATLLGSTAPTRWAQTLACDLGMLGACSDLGVLESDEGNSQAAAILYEKACNGGLPMGCYNLGTLFGKQGDETRAAELYQKACEEGLAKACHEHIEVACAMTGRNEGKCSFTNTGNGTGAVCGHVRVVGTDLAEQGVKRLGERAKELRVLADEAIAQVGEFKKKVHDAEAEEQKWFAAARRDDVDPTSSYVVRLTNEMAKFRKRASETGLDRDANGRAFVDAATDLLQLKIDLAKTTMQKQKAAREVAQEAKRATQDAKSQALAASEGESAHSKATEALAALPLGSSRICSGKLEANSTSTVAVSVAGFQKSCLPTLYGANDDSTAMCTVEFLADKQATDKK